LTYRGSYGVRMRGVGALVALGGVMAMAGGCGVVTTQAAAPATSAATVAKETASASTSPRPRCGTPSASALAAVDATVRAAGDGNRLPKAKVLADPDNGLWLIAGVFGGPAGVGEGALGIWATSADPTLEPFTGKVYAVDDAAVNWSTAPNADEVANDPRELPLDVLGCLNQR
jgi:hypothetical protein